MASVHQSAGTRDRGEREWLNLGEAANYVGGVGLDVLREAVNAGELTAKPKPRTRRQRESATGRSTWALFSRRELDRWMNSQPDVFYGPLGATT